MLEGKAREEAFLRVGSTLIGMEYEDVADLLISFYIAFARAVVGMSKEEIRRQVEERLALEETPENWIC